MDNTITEKKILIIRLHATGDTAITIPVCNFIKKNYPGYELHYLTVKSNTGLMGSFNIFKSVYDIGLGFEFPGTGYNSSSAKFRRQLSCLSTAFKLRKNKYDAVIDLQNNKYSRTIRKIISPRLYAEFEKYEALSHSQRIIDTFIKAGFENVKNDFRSEIREQDIINGKKILEDNGWDGLRKIILINPAGLYETRRWGLENYLKLSELLAERGYDIMISGTESIKKFSSEFKNHIGNNMINIAGKTSLSELPGILTHIGGIVSDDSGLFHLAWAMGKPGVLLLGATRADWTCQPGDHTICLNSSDLDCGNCMKETCKWGDTRCLKRYEPEEVCKKLADLIHKQNK